MATLPLLLLILPFLLRSSSAQDFHPISTFRRDISTSQVNGIQLPPLCPPVDESDSASSTSSPYDVKVPSNLVVTIVPIMDGSTIDVRTVPPHLVTTFVHDDLTMGFFWNFDAISAIMADTADGDKEEAEFGMIIQIPDSSLQTLEAWGGGVTIQLLVGATELSNIHLNQGASLHAIFDEARPSLTLSGLGTVATIHSEQGVQQVQVTNDATLHLYGNVYNSFQLDRAFVQLVGRIISGVDDAVLSMSDTIQQAQAKTTNTGIDEAQQLSTVSSKAILTVRDPTVCDGVVLILAGECVVEPDLQVVVNVSGPLTSHRESIGNETLATASNFVDEFWSTCVERRPSTELSSSSSSSTNNSVMGSMLVAATIAVGPLLLSTVIDTL